MQFEALQITQPSGRQVYAFAATADMILNIADIAHISRNENGDLIGYQRPEIIAHISEIRRYLDGTDAVLPNSIVIAFDDRVKFIKNISVTNTNGSEYGILKVPDFKNGENKPGFIVDGQQRLAAIASCRHVNFPVFVTAMVASDVKEQRKQFVLVNRTKPLPEGMVFEILPEIDGVLPRCLSRQRIAATIVVGLNLQMTSSLYHKIKTPTCPGGYIKDNSIRRLVLNSLSDGALYDLSQEKYSENTFLNNSVELISEFWKGLSVLFGDACDLPPEKSRLTHGVGIISMGYVMDHIFLNLPVRESWNAEKIASLLEPLRQFCAWTDGNWSFGRSGDKRWNELQNIDSDIRMLTNYFHRVLEQKVISVKVNKKMLN